MKNRYTWDEVEAVMLETIKDLNENTQFLKTKDFIQHGDVSVYEHCVMVMLKSCEIAFKLKADVDYEQMIKGALLHDYFLYDWHDNDPSHRLHGFSHPKKAYENAQRDTYISKVEGDIIRHHMFPLTAIPPQSKEAWIVCMADKICATKETLHVQDTVTSKFISA
ncbi:HD domain-containing protein [Lachnobacterium bovis]|uniref:HD domain-containing protein n=1 Tax=Lachnobacterium bovis TaxID=140626 RepID=UPI000552FBB2|nr:HD domain-containing protein [Lachnobacterium bovis]